MIFSENYEHQKEMFKLTRNQGELLWRVGNLKDALKYYEHQLGLFLGI